MPQRVWDGCSLGSGGVIINNINNNNPRSNKSKHGILTHINHFGRIQYDCLRAHCCKHMIGGAVFVWTFCNGSLKMYDNLIL